MTLRHSYVDSLQHILGDDVPNNGALTAWIDTAQTRESWDTVGRDWIERRQAVTLYTYGHHPLLGHGLSDHKYAKCMEAIAEEGGAPEY